MGLLARFALWFGLRRRCRSCRAILKRNVSFCQECGQEAPFTCLNCGNAVKTGMKFCNGCGQEAFRPQASLACDKCGKEVPATTAYCPGCGTRRDVTAADRPEAINIRAQRWEPELDQFAVRVDQLDLGEKLQSGIVIEPGVLGVLISNGRAETPLKPGRYQLGSLPSRTDNRVYEKSDIETMLLVCSGDQSLHFAFEGLKIAGNAPVTLTFDAVIRVRDPLAFVSNVMAGRAEFRTAMFIERYEGELRNAIAEAIAARPWEALKGDQKTKNELTALVSNHLKRLLERDGMELIGLQALQAFNRDLEQLDERVYAQQLRKRALNLDLKDFEIEMEQQVAGLDQRERRADIRERGRDLDISDAQADVAHHRRRAEVLGQMEQALVADQKRQMTTADEFAAFAAQIDKNGVLRADDLARFKRDLAETGQDHQLAREHLLLRLRSEREYELRALRFREEKGLSEQAIAFQLQQERTRLDHDIDVSRKKLDAQIGARRASAAAEIEVGAARRLKELELRRAEATTTAEVAKINLEVQKLQDEHDLALREKKQALDLKEKSERLAMALDAQRQKTELDLKVQAQRFAQELEQARIAADVSRARIEADKEIAKAKVNAAEDKLTMAERMARERREDHDKMLDRMERIALGSQANIANVHAAKDEVARQAMEQMGRVAASASAHGPTVVQPTIGAGPAVQTFTTAGPACAKCGEQTAAGDKFCGGCGALIA